MLHFILLIALSMCLCGFVCVVRVDVGHVCAAHVCVVCVCAVRVCAVRVYVARVCAEPSL